MGGGAHNCRRAAYAAAPAGAARADRHLLMQLHGCGPHDPVEPLALSLSHWPPSLSPSPAVGSSAASRAALCFARRLARWLSK